MKILILMIGDTVMVDTNIFIDLINCDQGIARKIKFYEEIFISPVVWVELYFGAYNSMNPGKQLQKVTNVLQKAKLMNIDLETAETFLEVKRVLSAKGNMIPDNDIWIASSAIQHQLPLYTNDKHFVRIDGLILS